MFSLIYAWINDWVNNREAGDLRRYRVHYDVTVMFPARLDDFLQANRAYNSIVLITVSMAMRNKDIICSDLS